MVENNSTSGPDLSGLRIDERARNNAGGRKAWRIPVVVVLALIVVIIVLTATRTRVSVVEVTTVRPGGDAAATALLNASGYVPPRRRATVAA